VVFSYLLACRLNWIDFCPPTAFERRRRLGRRPIPTELRQLVLRLVLENPRWGYLRVTGELRKLGHQVSASTVRRVLRSQRIPPAGRRGDAGWDEFLRAHARSAIACDLFTVDTVFLRRLYVFFFVELATRRVFFAGCSHMPVLVFIRDGRGVSVHNVGNGPALNIVFAQAESVVLKNGVHEPWFNPII